MNRPSRGSGDAGEPFIGRERELASIAAAIDDLGGGAGGVVLLSGEPGIGKTRLAEEATRLSAEAGIASAWGRCSESEAAPAYWPWPRLLRSLDLEAALPAAPNAAPGPAILDAEGARFRQFAGLVDTLVSAARESPILLVFDDLHAANAPALQLLQFAAREAHGEPILFVGTFREFEASAMPERAAALGAISREAQTLALAGLSLDEVSQLVGRSALDAPDGLAPRLHELTAGNPLFLEGMLRVVKRDGVAALDGPLAGSLSLGVQQTIRKRLDLLPPATQELLRGAAVFGTVFDVDVVAAAMKRPHIEAFEVLAAAREVALASPDPGDGRRWRFSHALVRSVLFESLSESERVSLHGRLAAVLEDGVGGRPDDRVEEIAHHLERASAAGRVDEAVAWTIRAAERSLAQLAFEGAADWFERAIGMLERRAGDDDGACADLWLRCGEAHWRGGQAERSAAAFRRAADVARSLGAPELLGRATLGLATEFPALSSGAYDVDLVQRLEEALHAQPADAEVGLRAMLQARLAAARAFGIGDAERNHDEAIEALDLARRAGEPRALLFVMLMVQWATWTPANLVERRARIDEMLDLARPLGRLRIVTQCRGWRLSQLLESGDDVGAHAELANWEQSVAGLREPYPVWGVLQGRALFAFLAGDLARFEKLATEGMAIGQEAGHHNVTQTYGTQLLTLRFEQGRIGEMVAGVEAFSEQLPSNLVWRCALAWALASSGRELEARDEIDRLAADEFSGIPRDMFWLPAAWLLAQAICRVGDTARAETLYAQLLPYADRWMLVLIATTCRGSMHDPLGQLATTAGSFDDAERHFEAALAAHARAPILRAWTQASYARMLAERGDAARAATLRAEALATARALGLVALEREVGAGASPSRALRPEALEEVAFRREGAVWVVGTAGGEVRIRHSRGHTLLAQLLAAPGEPFLVFDLDASDAPGRAPAAGDAGPRLDPEAKAEYRRHLESLRGELDEAQAHNDLGRIEQLNAELEFVERELVNAVGLGGRDRRASSDLERARQRVSRSIRRAITHIEEVAPELGAHLARSVATGFTCTYRPDPSSPIRWRVG